MFALDTLVTCVLSASLVLALPSFPASPIVDLQYALYQGLLNDTGNYYNFSNIRYAAPPLGNLRFAAPTAPAVNRTLNNAQQKNILCPQAHPFWEYLALSFLSNQDEDSLHKVEERVKGLEASLTIDNIWTHIPFDSRTSEDCLFLDVFVPKDVFNKKKSAPVMVWIHGGGYVGGDKTSAGIPTTLLSKSQDRNKEGIVYVSMNYRLGLFGWLAGSTFVSENGLPNAGLHDQRFAFEWVQKYIHLFGGDPSRVTIIGESAGAGSIMHHLTAWGSKEKAPFHQAILQSPGFPPIIGNTQQEELYHSVFSQAQSLISSDIKSTADLRKLDFVKLAALNTIITARSTPYGTFTFGPVVDGTYVPKLPGTLMKEGRYAPSIRVMTAHNSNEGLIFTNPFMSDSLIRSSLMTIFPTMSNATISYMMSNVWPATYDGRYPYKTVLERASTAVSEITFNCNARYVALAYSDTAYSYVFAMPPGFHGADVAYTYFNGESAGINSTVAHAMQSYIVNFVQTGEPNGPDLSRFPDYGPDNSVLVLSEQAIDTVQPDQSANDRCAWLQDAPLFD
ncbi:Carboxylesterase [Podosphaera aphanis]|nr:Carboxylesterase [Podosphaera aphanis]